ncbi:MAG: hypothetical protein PHO67_08245 [Candidatus Omnitrophica bacterium]|nr:hypothetical protein [Candidatus Omnitrophota bacterium]
MIRLLSDGILVGYGNIAFWLVVPFCGALLAHFVWYTMMAFIEWRKPEMAKLKAARAEDRHAILTLKAELCDIYKEMVALQKSEAKLRMVAEMTRSANRNVNAQVTEALK